MKDRINRDFPFAYIPTVFEELNNVKRRKRDVYFLKLLFI